MIRGQNAAPVPCLAIGYADLQGKCSGTRLDPRQQSPLDPTHLDAHMGADTLPERAAMTSFDDRENAFESKFAHDANMQFRAEARANKLLGLWAADLLGKTGQEAADYAITVVSADFEEAGNEDVVRKVAADLAGKASADEIRAKLTTLLPEAKAQLMAEL